MSATSVERYYKSSCIKENVIQRSFNDIIENDAFDHITENVLSNCDVRTIESCRTVCKSLNRVIMADPKSLDKIIMRIQFKRFLVHPEFKRILIKIEREGCKAQKRKLARMLINFSHEEFQVRTPMVFNVINFTNFFLCKFIPKICTKYKKKPY